MGASTIRLRAQSAFLVIDLCRRPYIRDRRQGAVASLEASGKSSDEADRAKSRPPSGGWRPELFRQGPNFISATGCTRHG